MRLGEAIRTARGQITQQALADAVGTDQGTVSHWERGKHRPSLEEIALIDAACGRPKGFVLNAAGMIAGVTTVVEAIEMDAGLSDMARSILRAAYERAIT